MPIFWQMILFFRENLRLWLTSEIMIPNLSLVLINLILAGKELFTEIT